jgi:SET domain-containing protein
MLNALINKSYVAKSPIHGWGVFALEDISKDEVVMQCVYKEIGHIRVKAAITAYTFGGSRIALGNASLLNAATGDYIDKENVKYAFDAENELITITALKQINKNEELLLKYQLNC